MKNKSTGRPVNLSPSFIIHAETEMVAYTGLDIQIAFGPQKFFSFIPHFIDKCYTIFTG